MTELPRIHVIPNLPNQYFNSQAKKPNLIDSRIHRKISKTINPVKSDYWGPVKSTSKSFYCRFIKPNFFMLVIIFIIIIVLFYRYKSVKKERVNKPVVKSNETKEADFLMKYYSKEKESAREPIVKYFNKHMDPAPIPKMAYPLYPYTRTGTLEASDIE